MLQGKIPIAHENCYSLVYSILNNYKSLENIQAVALPKTRMRNIKNTSKTAIFQNNLYIIICATVCTILSRASDIFKV